MKKILALLIFSCFFNCSNSQMNDKKHGKNNYSSEETKGINNQKYEDATETVKFTLANFKAVLIGQKIDLLDSYLKPQRDISNFNGEIVSINGISDSLFLQGVDFSGFCDSFWYVKVETESFKGIVNGRNVFRILDLGQENSFIVGKNTIEFYRTEFFGMGVFHDEELMGCPVNQPAILKETKNNYVGLVELVQNEYSNEASWGTPFPYFELKNDDGGFDRIVKIEASKEGVILDIRRDFQEGWNNSLVLLTYAKGKYTAQYLNFGKVKYE